MADHLVRQFKQQIDELALLPSDGGRFEIKVDDELIYSIGDEYRVGPIEADGVFSFDLPAKIEDGWTGPVSANSAVFYFYAYNDSNQNGKLDLNSQTHEDPVNIMLDESDQADTIFFVNDPDTFNAVLKNKVEYGWNYSHGGLPREYSQDFVREFVLTPL